MYKHIIKWPQVKITVWKQLVSLCHSKFPKEHGKGRKEERFRKGEGIMLWFQWKYKSLYEFGVWLENIKELKLALQEKLFP